MGVDYLGEPQGTPIHLSERFSRFVNYIGEKGGEHQASLDIFAEQLELPKDALRRIIERAKKLGVVRIDTHSTYVGMGRLPNSYHLRFDWSDWPKLRERFVEQENQKINDRIRKA